MKIVCVGRNYAAHAQELGNALPEEPLLFIKPDSALMDGEDFQIPAFTQNVHFECELVFQVNRVLKDASEEEAAAAISQVRLGLDFTARDVQDDLKGKGQPWEKAKGFDGSAYVSKKGLAYAGDRALLFSLVQNGETRQIGDSGMMVTPVARLLSYASRFFTISPDDYFFTGTPAGVGPVKPGDSLEGFIGEERFFSVRVQG